MAASDGQVGHLGVARIGGASDRPSSGSTRASRYRDRHDGQGSLKFSRDDEREADLVGLDIAARAGFDPRAGIALWRKMAR
jgi:predicted Zn-dependent protease